jgi:hypothetical protein
LLLGDITKGLSLAEAENMKSCIDLEYQAHLRTPLFANHKYPQMKRERKYLRKREEVQSKKLK